jgi:hypothetical protein
LKSTEFVPLLNKPEHASFKKWRRRVPCRQVKPFLMSPVGSGLAMKAMKKSSPL